MQGRENLISEGLNKTVRNDGGIFQVWIVAELGFGEP